MSFVIATTLFGTEGSLCGQELSARRFLRLGVVEGDSLQEFYRITDVGLIGDSLVAVASTQSLDVRLFDLRGQFVRSFGRKGEGPGEFRTILGFAGLHRDSIWIVDSYLQRVSVFSADRGFGRTISLATFGLGRATVLGVLPDGNFLLLRSPPVAEQILGWHDTAVELFRTEGDDTRFLGAFYWKTEYVARQPTGNPAIQAWGSLNPPGSIQAVIVPGDDGFWYADGRQPHIEKRRISDGTLVRTVPLALPSGRVDADSLRVAQQVWLSRQEPGWRRRIEAAVATIEPPPSPPRGAFALFVDERGSIWYAGHDILPRADRVWYRFGADGTTNHVRLPADFRVRSVRQGIIAGTEQDSLGVEYVTLYRIGSTH